MAVKSSNCSLLANFASRRMTDPSSRRARSTRARSDTPDLLGSCITSMAVGLSGCGTSKALPPNMIRARRVATSPYALQSTTCEDSAPCPCQSSEPVPRRGMRPLGMVRTWPMWHPTRTWHPMGPGEHPSVTPDPRPLEPTGGAILVPGQTLPTFLAPASRPWLSDCRDVALRRPSLPT